MPISYATLAQIEYEIKQKEFESVGAGNAAAPAITVGKKYLRYEAMPAIAARIDNHCQQTFAPLIETRRYDANKNTTAWYQNQLLLDRPLLVCDTVVIENQTLTQWDGSYNTRYTCDYSLYPYGRSPALALQGQQPVNTWSPFQWGAVFTAPAVYMQAIAVTGTWGFRRGYAADGWRSSGDSVQDAGGINASVTAITVNSVDGSQYSGVTPRFSAGQMLRIGTEFLCVNDTNSTTNTLTVERGIRGSTAAAHDEDATIEIWYPEPDIVRAAIRWAAYLYERRVVYETLRLAAGEAGTYTSAMPQDIPEESRNIIDTYINYQSARV